MASAVDIANIGLSHLGARAQISSISPPDGSVEAGYCARFYPLARREVIEVANFAFTKARATLAEVTNASDVWLYAYALPSDCIKPLRVLQAEYLNEIDLLWPLNENQVGRAYIDSLTERGSADFEIEGETLRTNQPAAVLLYKRDVTDTTKFTPLMTSAVGMVLAGYLAGPIIKGLEGARVGAQWREEGFRQATRASASNANASHEGSDHVPVSIGARL